MIKKQIISLVKSIPVLAELLHNIKTRYNNLFSVSNNYSSLDPSNNSQISLLSSSWQNKQLPFQQRKLVNRQLKLYKEGNPIDVFDVFVDSLNSLSDISNSLLLDIGCSSGYYSEICKLVNPSIQYFGCDYSESFIDLARDLYPHIDFLVCDATSLDYSDKYFDIVVSGCCLLHIPNYKEAIKESIRVSSRYVVFHRTPVVLDVPDQWYKKYAYGVETVEIHFNEDDFIGLLQEHGLSLVKTYTLHEGTSEDGNYTKAVRTYVCERFDS